jgi:RND family efflux transporter MFP subunit
MMHLNSILLKRNNSDFNTSKKILLLGFFVFLTHLSNSSFLKAQEKVSRVSVVSVMEEEVNAQHSFVGTVVPEKSSLIGSAIDGRIEKFHVREGQRVQKGQVIAELNDHGVQILLDIAKSELEVKKQKLAELEMGSLKEEKDKAEATMKSAKAREEYYKRNYARTEKLSRTRSVSNEEVQDAQLALSEATNTFQAAKASYELVIAGPREELKAQARAELQVQKDQIRKAEEEVAKHKIVAPFNGYVIEMHTELGQWAEQGAPVVKVAALDNVDIEVFVLEDYVAHLNVGTQARVEIGALDDHSFLGEVVSIVPQANLRSRSFPVRIRLENKSQGGSVLLKAGMFTRAFLPVGKKEKALLVPKDTLVLDGRNYFIYVFKPAADSKDAMKGTVHLTPVKLGVATGSNIVIKGKITEGDQVVLLGNERLKNGQEVEIVKKKLVASQP